MIDFNARNKLRRALMSMKKRMVLEAAYARGLLHTEMDLQFEVVSFLRNILPQPSIRNDRDCWVIGNNHRLRDGSKPDVLCYFVYAGEFESFLANQQKHLIGVIEIKYASSLKSDLSKLASFQRKHPERLAWIIYGDHFSQEIHAGYFQHQISREREMNLWSRGANRGIHVVKCSSANAKPRQLTAKTLDLMNKHFWIRKDSR